MQVFLSQGSIWEQCYLSDRSTALIGDMDFRTDSQISKFLPYSFPYERQKFSNDNVGP